MRILVCGGRNFADMPVNPHPEIPLKSGGYSHTNWDHPDIPTKNAQRFFVYQTLDKICRDRGLYSEHSDGNWMPENVTIISGVARGVDTAALDWGVINFVHVEEFPADWEKFGKSAGYIRNKQMLDEGKPDLVVAFPGGRGTAMMCDIAEKAGIEVMRVTYDAKKS